MKNRHSKFRKTVLCALAGAVVTWPALPAVAAGGLPLAQMPPGAADTSPAPDVIISLDDSGSMADKIDSTRNAPTKLKLLQDTLTSVFDASNPLLANGKIRLAWQSLSVDSTYEYLPAPNGLNKMKLLDDAHRKNFLDFVKSLKAGGYTPSHRIMQQAFNYMNDQSDSDDNPWATPGVSRDQWLACRRAYHIYLTDGGWNTGDLYSIGSSPPPVGFHPLEIAPKGPWPAPGTAGGPFATAETFSGSDMTLPDGTQYIANNAQTRIYYDASYPEGMLSPRTAGDATRNQWQAMRYSIGIPLADWAFIAWATNLSGLDAHGVTPTSEYNGAPATETIGTVTFDKYWNPKYDPATWQHLVTFSIGYGTDATEWSAELTSNVSKNKQGYPTEIVPYSWDGAFPNLMTNTPWPIMGQHVYNNYFPSDYSDDGMFGSGPVGTDYNSTLDLWHTAINGRGRFYAVKQADDLQKAFDSIFQKISDETSSSVAGIGASGSANVYSNVGLYTAGYDASKGWIGYVYADSYDTSGDLSKIWGSGAGTAPPADHKTTADLLDARTDVDSRVILTANDAGTAGEPFRWVSASANLSAAQQAALMNPVVPLSVSSNAQDVINFLRGDKSKETGTTPGGPLRSRQSRQGDIVNSGVLYVGAPASSYSRTGYSEFRIHNAGRAPMIYVGGNDGMLHGFSAADGSEKIAYVPKGLMDKLANLADPGYSHTYYVDNTPFSGDINPTATTWKTVLVGTLGAGARGYFVLDITDPAAFSDANADLVVMDKTESAAATDATTPKINDKDIGHIFAPPVMDESNPFMATQITRMNNGRWAVILGNGYNSFNERPVLYIQYLDDGKEVVKIPAGAAGAVAGNGLSAPRVVDLNGDGTADVVYAGDLAGNLWKFDLTSKQDVDWKVALGSPASPVPLYTAVAHDGAPASSPAAQPIFAPPSVKPNDRVNATTGYAVGGMMVAFGTGLNVTVDNRKSTDVQTIYSVLDNARYEPVTPVDPDHPTLLKISTGGGACPGPACVPTPATVGAGVGMLQKQELENSFSNGGQNFWTTTSKDIDWNSQKGWYMDLPAAGERLLSAMTFYDSSNVLAIFTQVPATGASSADPSKESCSGEVTPSHLYFNLIDIMDGKRPSISLIDMNHDNIYDASGDFFVNRVQIDRPGIPVIQMGRQTSSMIANDGAGLKPILDIRRWPETPVRPSWRQLP